MSSRQAIASMNTKSQFDVCGAPTRTVGRSGAGFETSFQRLTAQNAHAGECASRGMCRERHMAIAGIPTGVGTEPTHIPHAAPAHATRT